MPSDISEKERERLQAILNTSYSSAFVNGSLAGGLGTGALASIYPALYSLSDENPFRSPESRQEVQRRSKQNIVGFGTGGFLVGAPIGGVINTARLMLQKRRARKLLGKTAAWNVYAFNTGAGAAIGAGTGMAMNWALGRKLLDKRLLLGGTLAGGGIGAGVARTKDLQRKSFETSQRTLKDCVQRDEKTGNVLLGKQNIPLLKDGIYYIKSGDAGVSDQPIVGNIQAARDTGGHQQIAIICSTPQKAKYYLANNPKEKIIEMKTMSNGQYCFIIELGTSRTGLNGAPIRDNHGNMQKSIASAWINDRPIGENSDETSLESPQGFSWGKSYAGEGLLRAVQGKIPNENYLVYRLTDDEAYSSPEMLQKAMQSLVAHGTMRDGRLTPWSGGAPVVPFLMRMLGKRGYDDATCMHYVMWLIHGLQKEGLLPKEFSKDHFTDYSAIALAPSFKDKNVGVNLYGEWEPTEDILARRGNDPDLTTQYYREGFPLIPGVINGVKNILGYNTDNSNG